MYPYVSNPIIYAFYPISMSPCRMFRTAIRWFPSHLSLSSYPSVYPACVYLPDIIMMKDFVVPISPSFSPVTVSSTLCAHWKSYILFTQSWIFESKRVNGYRKAFRQWPKVFHYPYLYSYHVSYRYSIFNILNVNNKHVWRYSFTIRITIPNVEAWIVILALDNNYLYCYY